MIKALCSAVLLCALLTQAQEAMPPEVAPADSAAVVKALDGFWKTRDEAASMKGADEAARESLKTLATDYQILWRAARLRWWAADGSSDERTKKQLAKEGWNFAARAVAVKADGVEGKYYLAINIGAYSQAVGVLKALGEGLESKFNENLDFAIKTDPSFDTYGTWVSKGRYHYELPWPKRDLGKSKELLEKVLAKHPDRIRAHLFLAETLLKDGDAKGAKAHIDQVFTAGDGGDPAEAKRIRQVAKSVKEKIEKEL
jgi:tetratricopeptide (TPR) repeat protein